NRPGTHSGDAMNGNLVALENFKHSGMRNSAGEPASQREPDAGLRRGVPVPRERSATERGKEAANGARGSPHNPSLAIPTEASNPTAPVVEWLLMSKTSKFVARFLPLAVFLSAFPPLPAQRSFSGTAEIEQSLRKVNELGTVLMIAAHPDDERTAVLAYFARGRHMRTAYLSLTRGAGGQNLIGSEQGAMLGLIRTQELLAARQVDGAEQFFSRAIDFGFTRTAEETLQKWGHDRILGDVVWIVRKYRPDVIILGFSGTPRDGHGQHQTSAILGKEAFTAAADPNKFPEQLKYVQPWQAKRLIQAAGFSGFGAPSNEANPGPYADTGAFNPLLGDR